MQQDASFTAESQPGAFVAAVALQSPLDVLDRRLLRASGWILLLVALITVASLALQTRQYSTAVAVALRGPAPNHAATLAYTRALDAAVIKTSALMLAFIVVFLGAMYVLRKATHDYSLSIASPSWKGSLDSASPGLVMVTLGLITAIFVLFSHTSVNYTVPVAPGATTDALPIPAEPGLPMESAPANHAAPAKP